MIDFMDFIKHTNNVENEDELFRALETAVASLGYDRVAYSLFVHDRLMDKQTLSSKGEESIETEFQQSIPIHGPNGETATLSLISKTERIDPDKNILSLLSALAFQFHRVYHNLQENMKHCRTTPFLTKREKEVLTWCAKGKTNWDIAKILSISEHGVEFHLRNIFKKLSVRSRLTAVVKAIRFGFIDIPP